MMTDFPARAIVKINRIKKGLSGVVETSKDREGRVNDSILQDIGYWEIYALFTNPFRRCLVNLKAGHASIMRLLTVRIVSGN